jgi:hypothetical protein
MTYTCSPRHRTTFNSINEGGVYNVVNDVASVIVTQCSPQYRMTLNSMNEG